VRPPPEEPPSLLAVLAIIGVFVFIMGLCLVVLTMM